MRTLKPNNILINSVTIKRLISTLSRNRVPVISTHHENIRRYKSTEKEKTKQPAIPPPKIQSIEVQRPKVITPKDWNTTDYFKREIGNDGEYPHDTLGNMIRGLDTEELKATLREPENVKAFLQDLPKEYTKLKQLVRNYISGPPLVKDPEKHIEMLFTFDSQEKIDNFNVTTDADHDIGHSKASLTMTKSGSALFSGYLSTKLKPDGSTKYAGYVNMTSKRVTLPFWIPTYYNWEEYNHFVFKIRGDGRTYAIICACPGYYDNSWDDQYHYVLYTRGGPYWQISKIPFSKFYNAPGGSINTEPDVACGLNDMRVARFGITLADVVEGPFSLEIDYIGLQNKVGHYEEFAYEEYNLPFHNYA